MKSRIFLFVSLASLLVLACKKKDIDNPESVDFSHLSGNFLCSVDKHRVWSETYHNFNDQVVSTTVTGSFLHFQGFDFPIESETQTVFEYSGVNCDATLTFSNNYNNIELNYSSIAPTVWDPSHYDNYLGTRTSLPITTSPHNLINDILGQYQMDVRKKNTSTGLDTSYSEILLVTGTTINGTFVINIETESFLPGFFHTYSNLNVINTYSGSNYSVYDSLLWTNDSLYLTSDEFLNNSSDTISVSYAGNHL